MNRKTLITIHMYLAAFFAPFVLLVSISGGLYLVGVKGEVQQASIYEQARPHLDTKSPDLKGEVERLLADAGVEGYSFEYVKVSGSRLFTRPTSREHYVINQGAGSVEVIHAQPSLQSRLVELHKGHGPTAFKTFQKVFALGLLCVILSGLWLGLSAAHLRRKTLLTAAGGVAVFLLLAL